MYTLEFASFLPAGDYIRLDIDTTSEYGISLTMITLNKRREVPVSWRGVAALQTFLSAAEDGALELPALPIHIEHQLEASEPLVYIYCYEFDFMLHARTVDRLIKTLKSALEMRREHDAPTQTK